MKSGGIICGSNKNLIENGGDLVTNGTITVNNNKFQYMAHHNVSSIPVYLHVFSPDAELSLVKQDLVIDLTFLIALALSLLCKNEDMG